VPGVLRRRWLAVPAEAARKSKVVGWADECLLVGFQGPGVGRVVVSGAPMLVKKETHLFDELLPFAAPLCPCALWRSSPLLRRRWGTMQ
jgi:hypothetical protein